MRRAEDGFKRSWHTAQSNNNSLNGCLQKSWGEKSNGAMSVILYFLTPSFDLEEQPPLIELRNGNVEEVVPDAQHYGEMGSQ